MGKRLGNHRCDLPYRFVYRQIDRWIDIDIGGYRYRYRYR